MRDRHPEPKARSRWIPLDERPKVGTLASLISGGQSITLWCRTCRHVALDVDPGEMADLYGAELGVEALRRRARCSRCGARNAGLQVPGRNRRPRQ
jgi:hypothetical protein